MTRLERFRGGEVGFVLAIAAREVALGVPTWWYLVLVVVIGVLMIGLLTEEPNRDRGTRSGFKVVANGTEYFIELTTKSQVAVKFAKGKEYVDAMVVTYRWPGWFF